ncbi:hypothetical protein TVAG_388900 [Trichomonas vaginalis G3]|uniref:Raptor N-terminal CASPase-like domain-containing protein n=1 Tax=Trichomonas vaginalis (strain ATCC PRA-98 / G3) TaxID=412133 RepID=A2DYM2_TRIV3|nr:regulatory-associateD protein of MTOR family [Trichomonas vaginalis G3]EAY14557.1 hypothetical protein TVAG_388900 [Trichomonas vaginalis G3]KAI5529275.1 regulatory-associateD protein of MTOR family [Trichomonas vaginalis G3]|eukprot:XP_001326780.1 hypothetical protein [Trichomonas vaginalis G3]
MSSDGDGYDIDGDDQDTFSLPLDSLTQLFKPQEFKNSVDSTIPHNTDSIYDINKLNTPIFSHPNNQIHQVACAYLLCSSSIYFPPPDSEYFTDKPTIYMWRNMSKTLPSDFSSYVQEYFHDKYVSIKKQLRFFFQVAPSIEKLQNIATMRREITTGRILFHYIGYGFPKIKECIYAFDKKTNKFVDYPLCDLFDALKPPTWFIFDCSYAECAFKVIKNIADFKSRTKSTKTNWSDWFCFCATSANEQLPADPHLPRDFLTSCLLTPIRTAILCHILQYYRTTLVNDDFPLRDLDGYLLKICNEKNELTPLHDSLTKTLNTITDAIAAEAIPLHIYQSIFSADDLTTTLFRNFLLAQFLLRPLHVHPTSFPLLPDLSMHPLWQHLRTAIDISVFSGLTLTPSFHNDIFQRALTTFSASLDNNTAMELAIHIFVILFHLPPDFEQRSRCFKLLAKYASSSPDARKVLTKYATIDFIFSTLLSDSFLNDPSSFHAAAYLAIVMFESTRSFTNFKEKYDMKLLESALFNTNFPDNTRALVSVIIATLIPNNEQMRQIAVSEEFVLKLRKMLETSTELLSLWSLIIQRRMFDSFGVDLFQFYGAGLHIQTASFCLNHSSLVSAAAIATTPCLLQSGQDIVNMQLFGLCMLCGFDANYVVRFNFILFVRRFLSIYSDKIPGNTAIGKLGHQTFASLIDSWSDNDSVTSLGQLISDFSALCRTVQDIMRRNDSLRRFISIAMFFAQFMCDDPHPSVRKHARQINQTTEGLSGVQTYRGRETSNANSAPVSATSNFEMISSPGSFPSQFSSSSSDDETSVPSSNDNQPKPASCDSGGDALYKMAVQDLVVNGYMSEKVSEDSSSKIFTAAPIDFLETTNITLSKTYSFPGSITSLSFDNDSRAIACGFYDGSVSYIKEDGKINKLRLSSTVSSLDVVNIGNNNYSVCGTDNGCCYFWDMQSLYPLCCFRCDGSPLQKSPQLISMMPDNSKKFLTARGNCGAVKLWDFGSQKLINEWLPTANNKDNVITSLLACPNGNEVVVGYNTGLLVLLDVRADNYQLVINANVMDMSRIVDIKSSGERTFFAAHENGQVSQWTNFESMTNLMSIDDDCIRSFDVMKSSSVLCLSSKKASPSLISFDGKIMHNMKDAGSCACVKFHNSLPIVSVASANGKLYEYEIHNL